MPHHDRLQRPAVIALLLFAATAVVASTGCTRRPAVESADDDEEMYYDSSLDDVSASPPAEMDREATHPEAPEVLVRRPPTSTGERDAEAAGWSLFGQREDLGQCYTEAGGLRAGQGVVLALLDVSASGGVDNVLVGHSDIRDQVFVRCLEGVLEELDLDPSSRASTIQTYLVFGAEDFDQGRALLSRYRSARAAATQAPGAAAPLTMVGQLVQSCYERIFRGYGDVTGRLVLSLTLDDNGLVSSAEIAEDTLDGRLDQCVIDAVEGLRLDTETIETSQLLYPVVVQPGLQQMLPEEGARRRPLHMR